MTKPIDRRLPPVLGKQLLAALRGLDALGISGERQVDLLHAARRDMIRMLVAGEFDKSAVTESQGGRTASAAFELSAAIADRPLHEHMPIQLALQKLEDAFEALHRYREPGGEDEYLSARVRKRVISIKNSEARSGRKAAIDTEAQRSSVRDHVKIAKFLKGRNFDGLAHGRRKEVVIDAVDRFNVSESSVRRVIRDHGLQKAK